nr:ankyrin repeat domain containing protein [Mimivirus sp.]
MDYKSFVKVKMPEIRKSQPGLHSNEYMPLVAAEWQIYKEENGIVTGGKSSKSKAPAKSKAGSKSKAPAKKAPAKKAPAKKAPAKKLLLRKLLLKENQRKHQNLKTLTILNRLFIYK